MDALKVDSVTEALFRNVDGAVEVLGPTGRPLGRFIPIGPGLEPQIDEEEIRRRFEAGGGRPLADILADLEKLG